ncbi:fatty-acid-coa ligase FadD [Pelomyxa schiedti]|nr:fatty-acid-coa ligase FadD [Pelomyxa schiedti]
MKKKGIPSHGLWVGQAVVLDRTTNEPISTIELTWSLCLTLSPTFPAAFGASLFMPSSSPSPSPSPSSSSLCSSAASSPPSPDQEAASTPSAPPQRGGQFGLLRGKCQQATGWVGPLDEYVDGVLVRTWSATAQAGDDGAIELTGVWRAVPPGGPAASEGAAAAADPSAAAAAAVVTAGVFAMRKEEEGEKRRKGEGEGAEEGEQQATGDAAEKRHFSGLWLGQAAPDPSLEAFFIATNPIRWSLSIVDDRAALSVPQLRERARGGSSSSSSSGGSSGPGGLVFGCGFFDDAADVPNQPLLFFSLIGTFDRQTSTVCLIKEYEDKSAGYTVEYTGKIEQAEDKSVWFRGSWNNPVAGSFGSFSCMQQAASGVASMHIFQCDVCNVLITPGESRWSCADCPKPWCCCTKCYAAATSLGNLHPHSLRPEAVHEAEFAQGACSAQLIVDAFRRFPKRDFLGFRATASQKEHEWQSYAQVAEDCYNVACGLQSVGVEARNVVLFCCDIDHTYVAPLLASVVLECIVVPVHGALDADSLTHICAKTKPAACFVSPEYWPKLSEILASTSVTPKAIIIMPHSSTTAPTAPIASPQFAFFDTRTKLMEVGQVHRQGPGHEFFQSKILHPPRLPLSEITAVLFTSGSTGRPKGAMFNEELLLPSEGVSVVQPYIRLDFQPFDPSFLLSVLSTMQCGGCRAFAHSLATLMDDFKIARPTHVGASPVLWNSLHTEFCARVAEEMKNVLSDSTIDKKKQQELVEENVAKQMRAQLGNRLSVATSGGAPISNQVIEFARRWLSLYIVDLYGSRETGGISRDGVVYAGVDVQLLSHPEMGYYADGDPPQGEICVASPRLIPGYWGDEELTAAAFVQINGKRYYRTGDVGEICRQSGTTRVRVIDRCSNVFKLAQGEWLAPAKIEAVLEKCPYIKQALVTGSPAQPVAIAVVVPTPLFTQFWGLKPADESGMTACETTILREIRFWAKHCKLRPIEIPAAVHLERVEWTPENGLLTSTEKKRRQVLCGHYKGIVEGLYAKLSSSSTSTSASSTVLDEDRGETVSANFERIIRSVLPPGVSISPSATFTEIGGDSLSAARLVNTLAQEGLSVAPQIVFEYPLSHLSRMLEQTKSGSVVASEQYGGSVEVNWAAEWNLQSYGLNTNLSDTHVAPSGNRDGGSVFVTGCTGFLGPVLVSEILAQYPPTVSVHCLMRDQNETAAMSRLCDGIKDAGLWRDDYATRLHVVLGDLSKENYGLSPEQFQLLSKNLIAIYHSGARVNMTMPYSALKPANVGGTVTAIKLAVLAGRGTTLAYVSSVGALPPIVSSSSSSTPDEEALQCREQWLKLDSHTMGLKGGYGQSKAVAERLLCHAREILGVDARAFRPSAVSAHTQTGWCNTLDFTTLILHACVAARGIVADPETKLRWIPVDFVASAIVSLSRAPCCAATHGVHHLGGSGPLLSHVGKVLVSAGYTLDVCSPSEWRTRVTAAITPESPTFSVKHLLSNYHFSPEGQGTIPPGSGTLAALKQIGLAWPNEEQAFCPEVIMKAINFLITKKFLPSTP